MALHSFGCEVCLLAPPHHPALITDAIKAHTVHSPLRPLRRLRRTLLEVRPDTVIPADERTVLHLQETWKNAEENTTDGLWLRELIVRSLGSKEALFAVRSRMDVLRLAQHVGVPIPETLCVDRESDIESAAQQLGFPMVLKADMTSGGDGVHIVNDLGEAHRSWRKLHRPPNFLRALRRGLLFKNWTHLRAWARRETLPITAQRFVAGTERTSMAVCRQGEVTACACLEVVKTWQARGPSSVLRVVEDKGMERAMRAIAARLKLSGFCGFDFMVEHGTEQALLIEMNPRPTQTSHIPFGEGHDLPAAYGRDVLGRSDTPDREGLPHTGLIALFPQELVRDPHSEFLQEAYHDVPWEAPKLMERALSPLPQVIITDPRWKGNR